MDIILLKRKPGFRMNITRNKGLKEGRGGGGAVAHGLELDVN